MAKVVEIEYLRNWRACNEALRTKQNLCKRKILVTQHVLFVGKQLKPLPISCGTVLLLTACGQWV